MRVSVIVPVYNPGPYIESCVRSILEQSLGTDEVEGILVDDGSTDGTAARLDALAAEHPSLRVIHQENSGWPGKPRNVGIAAARGEYLFFLDNDDTLGREAMERMVAMASRNGSDIVLGKMAGFHRNVPKELFAQNRERATLHDTPLMDGLTPHKLFRRAFVETNGLRFPEGRRRLEDHVFVVSAYFAAESISVLADYVCYYHIRRDDGSNAGLRRLDPKGYYGNLREVLGIIEAKTEPGPFRDRLLERAARGELLGRLRERAFVEQLPSDYRQELFDEIRSVVADHVPATVDPALPPEQRVQMELLRADRLDLMFEAAEAGLQVAARARLQEVRRTGDQTFQVRFEAGLDLGDSPLPAVRSGDRWLLPVPERVATAVSEEARILPGPATPRSRLVLRRRDDWAELFPSIVGASPVDAGGPGLPLVSQSEIDPARISLGSPIWPGAWDVLVRVEAYGYTRDTRLGYVRGRGLRRTMRAVTLMGRPALLVRPYWTEQTDNLAVRVGVARPFHRRVVSGVRRRLARLRIRG